jgi:tRNA threonylcarbamoyladenosine biosynthesis protein TsaB
MAGMTRILALDTASAQCSVALLAGGELISRAVRTSRDHARLLLPMVDEVLAEAGCSLRAVDGIGFGRGPGSFTGVRIAVAVTQGLAAGAGLPVLPVSDLRALAEAARQQVAAPPGGAMPGWLLACMDARMGEVYWGVFPLTDGPVGVAHEGERVSAPEALLLRLGEGASGRPRIAAAAGMGLGAYPDVAVQLGIHPEYCLPQAEPHAADIARLVGADLAAGASWRDAATALPVYLRDKVVQVPL